MQHYKNTEKGRDEMCKAIEEYATDKAIDTVIEACIDFNKTFEETTRYVTSKFDNATVGYITSRYILLNKKCDK